MKTTTRFIFILCISGMTSNFATAQQDTNELISITNPSTSSFALEPANKVVIPSKEGSADAPLLVMSEKSKMIKLNHTLPAFTYSATLLIQDFTGRILKTFSVNLYNADANEFFITDLLSGTYNYTLVLNNQKKINGEFIVLE